MSAPTAHQTEPNGVSLKVGTSALQAILKAVVGPLVGVAVGAGGMALGHEPPPPAAPAAACRDDDAQLAAQATALAVLQSQMTAVTAALGDLKQDIADLRHQREPDRRRQ
jgi:hypothetical protein